MDKHAFAEFYEQTRAPLWRYLLRVCGGDRSLAEDVFQDAYVRVLQRAPTSFNHGDGRAYLYRLATNLLYDEFRTRRRVRRWQTIWGTEPVPQPDPHRSDLQVAFERLPLRQRSLLWLAHVEGYSHRQIADILGLKEKSVRVLLSRARRRLSHYVGHEPALNSLESSLSNPR